MAIKVLICDVAGAHANVCESRILAQCPTADVHIYDNTNLSTAVTYAINNSYRLICRPYEGLSDSYNNNYGHTAYTNGDIGIVHAHGGNDHIRITDATHLGYICAVGTSDGTNNIDSYGPGLEFMTQDTAQSYACAKTTGMIAQILTENPT